MRDLIISCIPSLDIVYCVKIKEVHSLVDYLRIIFRNSKSEYCKLELFYTDSAIFSRETPNHNLLENSNSFLEDYRDRVLSSVIKYDSYAECKLDSEKSVTPKIIDLIVSTYLSDLTDKIFNIKIDGLEILKVSTFMKPVSVVVILYKIGNIYCKPMKKFIGEKNLVWSLDEKSIEFENRVNEVLKLNLLN